MYWEDVYELYEFASNLELLEKNEHMKFQFMLHAGTKEAINKWKDIPIPFPDRDWKPPIKPIKRKEEDLLPAFSRHKSTAKMTPEQRERRDYVKKRVEESKLKAAEEQRKYYYGN